MVVPHVPGCALRLAAREVVLHAALLRGHALGRVAQQVLERHQDVLRRRVERDGQRAEQAAGQRHGDGQCEGPDVAPERPRKGHEEPVQGAQAVRFLAGLVDLGIGAGHERLEIAARVHFGCEGGDLRQAAGDALVEVVEALHLFEVQARRRIVFEAVQRCLQLVPVGTLGPDKPVEIDDHSDCLALTDMYSDTISPASFSWSTSENPIPRRLRARSTSRRDSQVKWPPRSR